MIETRKVIKISNRLTFTLPYGWCRKWGVKEGDKLPIYFDLLSDNKELAIFPPEDTTPKKHSRE